MMSKKLALLASLGLGLSGLSAGTAGAQESAIYGGGPFYSGGQAVMDDLRASGFTTIILWTLHVGPQGNMNLNNIPVIDTSGEYIGDPDWGTRVQSLRQAPSSVTRIEIGVASAGVNDFESIRTVINAQGTGPESGLYKAFENLKTVTGADAINIDDETDFNADTMVQFSVMLADIGYKVAFVPYNNQSFWEEVYDRIEAQRPGTIDRIYVQAYAGGTGNTPAQWNGGFGDLKVIPGLWSVHGSGCNIGDNPAQVQSQMRIWSPETSGGFMWLYDDIERCSATGRTTADYAGAINDAATASNNIAPDATITVSSEFPDPTYSKERLVDGISGFEGNGEWASNGEQLPFAELTWDSDMTIDEIGLYDRPSLTESIMSGTLTFSDGSTIAVDELPDNGTRKPITFAEKTVNSVRFQVTAADGPNIGLAEFQVFGETATQTSPPPTTPPPTTPPATPPSAGGGGGGALHWLALLSLLGVSLLSRRAD